MNDNNWKLMGRQQIINGLRYLEKVNPSSDSTGKGVLLIIQGSRFMFGIDPDEYLKKHYHATGSYSEMADKLGDLYSTTEWRKRMWKFLNHYDKNFTKVQKQISKKKQQERQQQQHSEFHQAFLIRYPHLSELKQEMQNAIVKGGQTFGKAQPDKKSPLNEIDVKTSESQMDVFLVMIEVRQPKSVATSKSKYRTFTAVINMQTNQFTFTDNHTIYDNYLKKAHKSSRERHKPFKVNGKFKNIVNLQPFFSQYLMLCKQKYQKLGVK